DPPPLKERVPTLTLMLPLFMNSALTVVMPVPPDLVNCPGLLNVAPAVPPRLKVYVPSNVFLNLPLLLTAAPKPTCITPPLRVAALSVSVAPANSIVDPAATLKSPLHEPPPLSATVPTFTFIVPVLMNTALRVVVPVPPDLVKTLGLLNTAAAVPPRLKV